MSLDRDESRGSRDDSDKQTSTAEAAQEHISFYIVAICPSYHTDRP